MEHGGPGSGIEKAQSKGAGCRIHFAVSINRIAQPARRPRTLLLRRHSLVCRGRRRVIRVPGSVGGRVRANPGERDFAGCTMAKVECRGQIAGDSGTPASDVVFAWLETKTCLDETDQRCMVEDLGVDPSPGTPGGDDQHRHTHPETVGSRCKSRIPCKYLICYFNGG